MKKMVIGLFLVVCSFTYGQLSDKQKAFFDKKMDEINLIPSINVGFKANLLSTYTKLCIKRTDLDEALCLKISVSQTIKDTSIIHALYKQTFDSWTSDKYVRAIQFYKDQFKLCNEQTATLSGLLYGRSKELVMAYYQCPEDETRRYVLESQISDSYNGLVMIALTKLGFKTYLARYCSAMDYWKELELSASQIDEIVKNAVEINLQSERMSNYTDLKYEEYRRLHLILTEKQYDTYLTCKVAPQAKLQTAALWDELKLYSGAADLDSTTTYGAIYPYLVQRFKIEERYKILPGGETEAAKQKTALYKMCPEQLLRLYALRKREVQKNADQTKFMTW